MSKESITTSNREEARRIINKLHSNIHCLNNGDLKVLDHLGKKGFYDDKRVIIINKDSKLNNLVK